MLVSLILGALVGAVLGLTGAGGGILAVPALVAGMGWPLYQASPVALIAVAISAAVGTIEAFRQRLVRYRAALLMAASGVPMTWFGVRLAHTFSQRILLLIFSVVMLIVASRILLQVIFAREGDRQESRYCVGRINPATGRLAWTGKTALALAGTGATAGLLTGMLGIGGGFIIVPMLRKFTNVPMHGVVATSLMVIALVGTGGVISTLLHGTSLPVTITLLFSISTAAGMLAGRCVARRLTPRYVQLGFAVILIVVALGLIFKAAFSG